jgi:hypothetical protein
MSETGQEPASREAHLRELAYKLLFHVEQHGGLSRSRAQPMCRNQSVRKT